MLSLPDELELHHAEVLRRICREGVDSISVRHPKELEEPTGI